MRWGGDFGHEWSLPHSLRADENGWRLFHNNSCRSNYLFWHYINPWKRCENALSMHSVMWGLYLVLLFRNQFSPSAFVMSQWDGCSFSNHMKNIDNKYICSPGVTKQVLLVTWVELKSSLSSLWTKPIASSRRAFKSLSMHSVQSAHDNSFERNLVCQSLFGHKGIVLLSTIM